MTGPARDAASGEQSPATLSYVYAVARATPGDGADAPSPELRGIGDTPVRWVAEAGLTAVVGDVERSGFEERALAEGLEDLQWLATTARAHHHVVDTIGRVHLVAPMALATVYYDDDRVREVLAAGRDGFHAVLDRLEGRAEFGVKIYARPGDAARTEAERPRSGAEYLRARRRALREGESANEQALQAAGEVDDAVSALAAATRTHRPQDASLSGADAPMLLNRAYLVPVERAAELATLVGGFADHPRLRVELTGPWVPYSFTQDVFAPDRS